MIFGFPNILSASFIIDITSLELPYNAHLTETDGIGFSTANLKHPAMNYSSVITFVLGSPDIQENIYALIYEIGPEYLISGFSCIISSFIGGIT